MLFISVEWTSNKLYTTEIAFFIKASESYKNIKNLSEEVLWIRDTFLTQPLLLCDIILFSQTTIFQILAFELEN